MPDENLPTGQLFSRLYLERGKPQMDSPRFRARFVAKIDSLSFNKFGARNNIRLELGLTVGTYGSRPTYFKFESFINSIAIADLLSCITIIYQAISLDANAQRKDYIAFVSRAMREENMSYRLDEAAGVHYFVDEEFERSRSATLAGLMGAQFEGAREALEQSHKAMLSQDTLTAVRRAFDAVENVFKLRFDVSRLGASEIKSKMNPLMPHAYSGRGVDAANRLIASFSEWTNAAHQYRHAPGEADPSPPSTELAVLLISQANANLRWLLDLPAAKD